MSERVSVVYGLRTVTLVLRMPRDLQEMSRDEEKNPGSGGAAAGATSAAIQLDRCGDLNLQNAIQTIATAWAQVNYCEATLNWQ